MIRSGVSGVEGCVSREWTMGFPTWKDGPDGLLESGTARVSVLVLGDASRGALYLALRPAASTGESPSPPPPERRALTRSDELAGGLGLAQAAPGPDRERRCQGERRQERDADLRGGARQEAAARFEHARDRVDRRHAVDPAFEQRE